MSRSNMEQIKPDFEGPLSGATLSMHNELFQEVGKPAEEAIPHLLT